MEESALRHLIRSKLADGSLPQKPIKRIAGGISRGEECLVCELTISEKILVIEAYIVTGSPPVHFHLGCFYMWNAERKGVN